MTVYPLSLKNLNKALFWPNKNDCFTKWDEFLALGIPTACMECLEWWAFDILILITGVIGVEEQAANVIIMNIVFDASMIAYGMQEALTTLVGNCIGANQVKLSKKITLLIVMASSAVFLLISLLLFFTKSLIVSFYTKNSDVSFLVLKTFKYGAFVVFLNGLGRVFAGPILALGMQKFSTISSFVAYYIIGIPISLLLTFYVNMEIVGIWIGLLLAVIV